MRSTIMKGEEESGRPVGWRGTPRAGSRGGYPGSLPPGPGKTLTRTHVVAQHHQDEEGEKDHPEAILGPFLSLARQAAQELLTAGLRRGSHDGLLLRALSPLGRFHRGGLLTDSPLSFRNHWL